MCTVYYGPKPQKREKEKAESEIRETCIEGENRNSNCVTKRKKN